MLILAKHFLHIGEIKVIIELQKMFNRDAMANVDVDETDKDDSSDQEAFKLSNDVLVEQETQFPDLNHHTFEEVGAVNGPDGIDTIEDSHVYYVIQSDSHENVHPSELQTETVDPIDTEQ